ncbi:Probable gamma-glutamyl hydrolase 3 [Striga hermonthica]|uniref:Probable gamma-glutamyl hydrolase 3 n=1 Tax=Striga hermonthica TaxID=68872 RepID=A0A9N7RJN4_STRHE|nr:Probable gamma-glutamyl hydrolase 3 [Striga hermonthica]
MGPPAGSVNLQNASYIAASYMKFLESAGARVVPLIYYEPKKTLDRVIHHFMDLNIMEKFDATNHASSLRFMDSINLNRTVFQWFPPALLKKMKTEFLVMHNHRLGISTSKFRRSKKLCDFFKIITTSADRDDKEICFDISSTQISCDCCPVAPRGQSTEHFSDKLNVQAAVPEIHELINSGKDEWAVRMSLGL